MCCDGCRLEEQADYAAARELFGDAGSGINLDVFLPKSLKDFEDYAYAIAGMLRCAAGLLMCMATKAAITTTATPLHMLGTWVRAWL